MASQDQNYGLGGITTGRAGAVTAEPENPYAALYNPALLAAQKGPRLVISSAIARSSYNPFPSVLLDSPDFRTATGARTTGDAQIASSDLALWSIGLSHPVWIPRLVRRVGLGVVVSGPFNKLRTFQAGTPYDFASLRYGGSDSQFKGTLSAAVEIWPEKVFFGAGLSMFITSAGAAEATIAADNPTGRFALDVGLNTAAILGLYVVEGKSRASLVFRQEIAPAFEQRFIGKVQVGRTDTLYQPMAFRSTLYFEPHTFEADLQHDFELATVSLGVGWQMWSRYQPSFLVASATRSDGIERQTEVPALRLKNTWNPRIAADFPLWNRLFTLSAGYQWRPTPLSDTSGSINLVDSDAHIFGLGFLHHFAEGFSWGLAGQYHFRSRRSVSKPSNGLIGAPGYEVGGEAYTYGLSLQAEL